MSKKREATVFEMPATETIEVQAEIGSAEAPVAVEAPAEPAKKRGGRKPKAETAPTEAATQPPETKAGATPAEAATPRRERGGRKADAVPAPAVETGPAETPPSAPAGTLTMASLSDRYIASLRDAGKGLGTQFSYQIDLAVAVRHFGADTDVANLTVRKVENFFQSDAVTKTKSGRAKAQPGIDKTRRVLRLALVWAAEQGLLAEAPIPESALPKQKPVAAE